MTTLAIAALLCSTCRSPLSPSARATPVLSDVLDYIVGDPTLWPRIGNHYQEQILDLGRREVCWVKYANPRRFECWRWDDQFIYHEVDHALDGDSNESYSFTDGRWLPRRVAGTWSLDVSKNEILWFDGTCHLDPARSYPFPYRQRAWLDGAQDVGGDLGIRDVLVLEYEPYNPAGGTTFPEWFYFAKGAGWYRWERGTTDLVFNRRGGPIIPIALQVRCATPS
jgi:hypothetical protein